MQGYSSQPARSAEEQKAAREAVRTDVEWTNIAEALDVYRQNRGWTSEINESGVTVWRSVDYAGGEALVADAKSAIEQSCRTLCESHHPADVRDAVFSAAVDALTGRTDVQPMSLPSSSLLTSIYTETRQIELQRMEPFELHAARMHAMSQGNFGVEPELVRAEELRRERLQPDPTATRGVHEFPMGFE